MADSDEELDKKRRDRDKFKRERECSERVEISDVKRRHPSLASMSDDKLKSRIENSPTLRSNKRLKRESQDFQNFPFPWQPFDGERISYNSLKPFYAHQLFLFKYLIYYL